VTDTLDPATSTPSSTSSTRSAFGGLWSDRFDAADELVNRTADGRISSDLVPLLMQWMADGYVIIPAAVDASLCDELANDLATAWREGHPNQIVVDSQTGLARPLVAGDQTRLTRAVDSHVHFDSAQRTLASSMVNDFLRAIFDADPLYFQTLVFEVGSEQQLHQDTAFVVVDRPLEMVGVWFALEDVKPGSGELQYVPGSQRLPDHCFAPGRRHYDPTVDPRADHDNYYANNVTRCDAAGLPTQRFYPRKGDALIWSADLMHGGSPITDGSLTRRSLVGHACPQNVDGNGPTPHFFSYLPGNRVTKALPGVGAQYASQYHQLAAD
jgi:phytanoyl-CoA hydroxylase